MPNMYPKQPGINRWNCSLPRSPPRWRWHSQPTWSSTDAFKGEGNGGRIIPVSKSPKDGCGTTSKWPWRMAYKLGGSSRNNEKVILEVFFFSKMSLRQLERMYSYKSSSIYGEIHKSSPRPSCLEKDPNERQRKIQQDRTDFSLR